MWSPWLMVMITRQLMAAMMSLMNLQWDGLDMLIWCRFWLFTNQLSMEPNSWDQTIFHEELDCFSFTLHILQGNAWWASHFKSVRHDANLIEQVQTSKHWSCKLPPRMKERKKHWNPSQTIEIGNMFLLLRSAHFGA